MLQETFQERITLARLRQVGIMCLQHYKRNWHAYALLAASTVWFIQNYQFEVNMTDSLPQSFFIVAKGTPVQRGEYAAFIYKSSMYYRKGIMFVKQLRGMPGDKIIHEGKRVYLKYSDTKFNDSGIPVAVIKKDYMGELIEQDKFGNKLPYTQPTIIGKDEHYVYAPHPHSLDSRYALVGLVKTEEIIGRAYPIF